MTRQIASVMHEIQIHNSSFLNCQLNFSSCFFHLYVNSIHFFKTKSKCYLNLHHFLHYQHLARARLGKLNLQGDFASKNYILFCRDISLTDFKGSYLIVFFFPSDFENDEDLISLHENLKLIKKHSCDVIACSTDSTMMHSKWVQQLNNEGKNDSFTIPLMSDKIGSLRYDINIVTILIFDHF